VGQTKKLAIGSQPEHCFGKTTKPNYFKNIMKTRILTALVVAVVALTSMPIEAFAQNRNPVPTQRQLQSFARLNAQLNGLRPGSARAISLARRMINLVPTAAAQVMVIATTKVTNVRNAQVLAALAIQTTGTFSFTDAEKANLIVASVETVARVAVTIPRIVASAPAVPAGDAASQTARATDLLIRGASINNILADPNLDSVVENDAIPRIAPTPTPTPTPTPVPYGA
jgi:hypothetical protein